MIKSFRFKDFYYIDDLIDIMRCLRSPGGCPWDAEQTHESIKYNLIEETYEVIEAINKNDPELLKEELGDVLLQVIFHSQLEAEHGVFEFNNVVNGICQKLIERHPHVFGDTSVNSVDDVLNNWDSIKRQAKGQESCTQAMNSIPRELPALIRSTKIQQKAKKAGFDWPTIDGAIEKLQDEVNELKAALDNNDKENAVLELGDVIFSAVNVSRFLDCNAEEALTKATDKFVERFAKVEELAAQRNIDMKSSGLDELDRLWEEVKHYLK
jgi:tetrapyrrole methylase family protein/MazG family protein